MENTADQILSVIKTKLKGPSFEAQELYELLKKSENDLLLSTFRWRLHQLKTLGKIESVGRGKYSIAKRSKFNIGLNNKLQNISKEIKKEFPYANFCIWSSDILNEFTIHQPTMNFVIVEVEKDALTGVFSYLKEHHQNVLLNPSEKEMNLYLGNDNKSVIVKTLIQRAPTEKSELSKFPVPKIEKILVDLLVDTDLFSLYQGSELKNIWRETFKKYSINQSTLNSYAKKRYVQDKAFTLVNEIKSLIKGNI